MALAETKTGEEREIDVHLYLLFTPMKIAYSTIVRKRRAEGHPHTHTHHKTSRAGWTRSVLVESPSPSVPKSRVVFLCVRAVLREFCRFNNTNIYETKVNAFDCVFTNVFTSSLLLYTDDRPYL